MNIYDVRTEHFGIVQVEAASIRDARAWARTSFGVRNPENVSVHQEYVLCDACDSRPCVCAAAAPSPREAKP